jgi:7,8-dihydropterin-6-yl-methyl-4-(beta-D-ribofuranosyl)aminobenzene 5'-phosphate synthase
VEPIPLEPIDSLSVTTLVDNVTDLLLADQGLAKRAPQALSAYRKVPARSLEGDRTGDLLRAEHGFSCLVTMTKSDRTTRILFDAGATPDGLVDNMRRLELSPRDIDIIVLSHGHCDHTTGMDGLVSELGATDRFPFSSTPSSGAGAESPSRAATPIELPSTSKPALEGAGFEIVEQRQPTFLLDGSLLVTGEVDRPTEFEQGFPVHQAHTPSATSVSPERDSGPRASPPARRAPARPLGRGGHRCSGRRRCRAPNRSPPLPRSRLRCSCRRV